MYTIYCVFFEKNMKKAVVKNAASTVLNRMILTAKN